MLSITPRQPASMSKSDIMGEFDTAQVTHFDGNERTLFYTNTETPFPHGEKIISLTNQQGIIINVNSTFVTMSGYSRDELLGMPHYILHHPDMPRAAFKEMWKSLDNNDSWSGYVKNLRKDGGYYWVFAKIFTLYRHGKLVGYTSTRTAANPSERAEAEKLYQRLLIEDQTS